MSNPYPEQHGITIKGANGHYIVTILSNQQTRKKKPTASIIGTLVLFTMIAYPLYVQLFVDPDGSWRNIIGLLAFLSAPILFVFTLMYRYYSDTTILLTKDTIFVNRKNPIGLNYNAKKRTSNWNNVRMYSDLDSIDSLNPITGIELTFFEESNLVIGQHLGLDDRRWLIKKLKQIKVELLPDLQSVNDATSGIISLSKLQDQLIFTIPKAKWNSDFTFFSVGYLTGMVVFIIGAKWLWSVNPDSDYVLKIFFSVLAVIPVFAIIRFIIHLIKYKGETLLILDKKKIVVKRTFFGFAWLTKRLSNDLEEVTDEVGFFSTNKTRHRKQLVLKFRNAKNLKLGFYLAEQEVEWIKRVILHHVKTVNITH